MKVISNIKYKDYHELTIEENYFIFFKRIKSYRFYHKGNTALMEYKNGNFYDLGMLEKLRIYTYFSIDLIDKSNDKD